MKNEQNRDRINLSIGLLAGFLTVIYALSQFLPKQTVLKIYLTQVIYGYLGITCILLFLFLLTEANLLRYDQNNWNRYVHNPPKEKMRKFFFDSGIDLALFAPYAGLIYTFLFFIPDFLSEILIIKYWAALIMAIAFWIFLDSLMAIFWKKINKD